MGNKCRAVLDTNVLLAAEFSSKDSSPNVEIFDFFVSDAFILLFSDGVIDEYAQKLLDHGIEARRIEDIVFKIQKLGERVETSFFHLSSYPKDPDDICFILCAHNGDASHLVSYDRHLLDIDPYHPFKICQPIPFLEDLRNYLAEGEGD